MGRQPAHNIRDPDALIEVAQMTGECVCAPGNELGVQKTVLTAKYPLEIWAGCEKSELTNRPYSVDCNRVLLEQGKSIEFPFEAVSYYDTRPHIHLRVATKLADAATPHYDENNPWLHHEFKQCACARK